MTVTNFPHLLFEHVTWAVTLATCIVHRAFILAALRVEAYCYVDGVKL